VMDRFVNRSAWFDLVWPSQKVGYVDTTLKKARFPAAIGLIQVW
jgi:hypothetical protein